MKKFILIVSWLLLLPITGFAKDITVSVHQTMINKFLSALGTLQGSGMYQGVLAMPYTWKVSNPRIEITKEKAEFVADTMVDAGLVKNNTTTRAGLDISYNAETNKIGLKLKRTDFTLFLDLLGARIPITTVDLSQFYSKKMEFSGPKPIQSSIELNLPGGGQKTIYMKQLNPEIKLSDKQILILSDMVFTDKKETAVTPSVTPVPALSEPLAIPTPSESLKPEPAATHD